MSARYLCVGLKLARKALLSGGRLTGPTTIAWNIAGRCTDPVHREVVSRPSPDDRRHAGAHSMSAHLTVKCRRCSRCLQARSHLWQEKVHREIAASARSWFGTLTFSPEEQFRALSSLRVELREQGLDFEGLTPEEKFRLKVAKLGEHVTNFFKRVRKETGAKVRYIVVAEAHKSGEPHFHAIVHEASIAVPVRHAVLKRQWSQYGFSDFKLVASAGKSAHYVCKYLTKAAVARVRASLRYGAQPLALWAQWREEIAKFLGTRENREAGTLPATRKDPSVKFAIKQIVVARSLLQNDLAHVLQIKRSWRWLSKTGHVVAAPRTTLQTAAS